MVPNLQNATIESHNLQPMCKFGPSQSELDKWILVSTAVSPNAFCIYPPGLCTNQPALHRTFHLNLLVLPPLAQSFVALSPLSVTGRQAVLAALVSHGLVAGLHRRCAAAAYRAPSSALRCQPSGLWLVLSLLFLLSALFLLSVLARCQPSRSVLSSPLDRPVLSSF